MGYCGPHNRPEYLNRILAGWSDETRATTIRKHHAHGSEDWLLLDIAHANGEKDSRIVVLLWEGHYVKDVPEECGPYAHGCPIEWLDEVPDPGGFATEWRARMRRLHEAAA